MNDDDFTFELDTTVSDEDNITINLGSFDSNTDTYSITGFDTTNYTTSTGTTVGDVYAGPTITIGSDAGSIYNVLDNYIDPDQVEHMCETYPALSKVWRNFKSVYDMTLQDWKGNNEEKNN